MQHKFICMNFTREKYIGFIVKYTEVWHFGFIIQEDLLRIDLVLVFKTSKYFVIS